MHVMSAPDPGAIVYPSSDGQPMAENELQGWQIMALATALRAHFRDRPDVHVGADLLWYPVEGDPSTSRAPDVFVVPGRPAAPPRPSWLQWQEDGVPLRHVIEILSPSNTPSEMSRKRRWYSRYGVEEYLVFDPEDGLLEVHVRTDLGLVPVDVALPWWSSVVEGIGYRVEEREASFELVAVDAAGEPLPTMESLSDRVAALEAKLRDAGIDPT